jgi:hypothetical protein
MIIQLQHRLAIQDHTPSGLATLRFSRFPVVGSSISCQFTGFNAPGICPASTSSSLFADPAATDRPDGNKEALLEGRVSDDKAAVAKMTPRSFEAVVKK